MGFVKNLKVLYDAHMKQVRDRNAEDVYVYDQGLEAGSNAVACKCSVEDVEATRRLFRI